MASIPAVLKHTSGGRCRISKTRQETPRQGGLANAAARSQRSWTTAPHARKREWYPTPPGHHSKTYLQPVSFPTPGFLTFGLHSVFIAFMDSELSRFLDFNERIFFTTDRVLVWIVRPVQPQSPAWLKHRGLFSVNAFFLHSGRRFLPSPALLCGSIVLGIWVNCTGMWTTSKSAFYCPHRARAGSQQGY